MAGSGKISSVKQVFMKTLLLILFSTFWVGLRSQSQSTGYVLQMADGSIRTPDSSITVSKIQGLNQWLSGSIKTVNNTSLLGEGNVSIDAVVTGQSVINALGYTPYNATNPNNYISSITGQNVTTALGFTPLATNGNGSSLTGLTKSQVGLANVDNTSDANKPVSSATQIALDGKQSSLVSGSNIKTINGSSLLGSGDLVVGGGALTTTAGVGASPTSSSTQTITHNLGRVPNTIRIYGYGTFTSNAAATATTSSMGVFNSSGNFCVYQRYGAAITTTQAGLSSNTFAILLATGGGNFISGVIQNVTSTQFDIVWTETGTATAQVYLWEAQ